MTKSLRRLLKDLHAAIGAITPTEPTLMKLRERIQGELDDDTEEAPHKDSGKLCPQWGTCGCHQRGYINSIGSCDRRTSE